MEKGKTFMQHLYRVQTLIKQVSVNWRIPFDVLHHLPPEYVTQIQILQRTTIGDTQQEFNQITIALTRFEAMLNNSEPKRAALAANRVEKQQPILQQRVGHQPEGTLTAYRVEKQQPVTQQPYAPRPRRKVPKSATSAPALQATSQTTSQEQFCEYYCVTGTLRTCADFENTTLPRDATFKANTGNLSCAHSLLTNNTAIEEQDSWLLDSGVNAHMVCRKDWFTDFESIKPIPISLANNSGIEATGRGKVIITMKHRQGNSRVSFREEYYVLKLVKNLLSPNWIVEKGFVATHDH